MLVIRDEQMKTLRSVTDLKLIPELLKHVRIYFPDVTENKNDIELTDKIRFIIKQAREYSLFSKRSLFRFVNLVMMFGDDWEKNRNWMHKCMLDPNLGSPDQRLIRVYHRSLYVLA